jgi:hypothetical protein
MAAAWPAGQQPAGRRPIAAPVAGVRRGKRRPPVSYSITVRLDVPAGGQTVSELTTAAELPAGRLVSSSAVPLSVAGAISLLANPAHDAW